MTYTIKGVSYEKDPYWKVFKWVTIIEECLLIPFWILGNVDFGTILIMIGIPIMLFPVNMAIAFLIYLVSYNEGDYENHQRQYKK